MLRFLADENFNNQIVRGILRRNPDVEIVRVQDIGLIEADVAMMTNFAYRRMQTGLGMPGLFEVSRHVSVGLAIEEILVITECSLEGEWEGQVRFLPLR
ncbi:hypothetical protein [Microcoleus sp. D3_18_C4]|uniref:hypothetical protein n=1 Tax=Microcoleus sp. D3_18_C4 TaxID=3055335 RepID=UPI002FD27A26